MGSYKVFETPFGEMYLSVGAFLLYLSNNFPEGTLEFLRSNEILDALGFIAIKIRDSKFSNAIEVSRRELKFFAPLADDSEQKKALQRVIQSLVEGLNCLERNRIDMQVELNFLNGMVHGFMIQKWMDAIAVEQLLCYLIATIYYYTDGDFSNADKFLKQAEEVDFRTDIKGHVSLSLKGRIRHFFGATGVSMGEIIALGTKRYLNYYTTGKINNPEYAKLFKAGLQSKLS